MLLQHLQRERNCKKNFVVRNKRLTIQSVPIVMNLFLKVFRKCLMTSIRCSKIPNMKSHTMQISKMRSSKVCLISKLECIRKLIAKLILSSRTLVGLEAMTSITISLRCHLSQVHRITRLMHLHLSRQQTASIFRNLCISFQSFCFIIIYISCCLRFYNIYFIILEIYVVISKR